MMDGKCLAGASDALDAVALQLGVRPLSEFISADPVVAVEFVEDAGADSTEVNLPALQQFSPQEGLETVRALTAYVQTNPTAVGDSAGVVQDLRECERILITAAQQGAGWHFEVDF